MAELCQTPDHAGEEKGPHLLFSPNEAHGAGDFLSPQNGADPSLLTVSEKSKLLWGGSDGLKLRQRETPKRVLSIHKISTNRRNTPTKSPLRKQKSVNFKSPKPANRGKSSAISEDKENNASVSKSTPSSQGKGKKFTPRPSRVLTSRDTLSTLEDSNISPRALKAIILDNPATRAEYLSRQSPTSREQVKMYGTPQLAGRLGIDRFPDAPKQFVKAWTPSKPLMRKSLGKRTPIEGSEKPQSTLPGDNNTLESIPTITVEAINDYDSESLAFTPTVSAEADQTEEATTESEIEICPEKDKTHDEAPEQEQELSEDESIKSTTDHGHMYDYFLTEEEHLASSITCDDEVSIDSVLKARLASEAHYNCDALISGDLESAGDISRYVDLDDYYCPELNDSNCSNNESNEVNEPVVMSTEVAVVDSRAHPFSGTEPCVPPEKARCGSCVIL